MKKYILTIITAFFVASCGGDKQSLEDILATNDLKKIRTKKDELDKEQQAILDEIKLVQDKIASLDTVKKRPLVTTFTAKSQEFVHHLDLQGSVQTKKNVLIYPESAGQITSIYVKEGQRVGKGQILARLDDGGVSQQLAQAQVQSDLAKTTYERQQRLWNQKIGSEMQYLQAKATYDASVKTIKQLQQVLAKSTIRAPFSGIIDDVIKEQGTVVAPGMGSEVFRIVNLSDMYIETNVPESYIKSIKKGKAVDVEFPILDKNVKSKIRQAGNFINPANRTFKIEVAVPNRDRSIKPNMTAKLQINDYTNTNAILIPQSIISENAKGEQYIYTITDVNNDFGKAKLTPIKTGKTQDDIIEVLEGLKAGDIIIEEGARSVKNGQEVQILETAKKAA